MLPLHSQDKEYRPGWRMIERVSGWMRLIFSEKNSRNLFMFLVLNLGMAFIELLYGVWTNSLGLIADSFHMFFDCTALLAGLVASLIARWRADEKFSYGYVRAEVLAGFVNGLFLLFIAFFIFSEAVERIFEPPEVKHDRLFLVSVAGFLVNLIGIFAFQDAHGHGHSHGGGHGHSHSHSHSSHSHNSHAHSHPHDHDDNPNPVKTSGNKIMEGVFLHIMADTLGSVGVIISSGLIHYFHWHIADPICSLLIAILIGISVVPLLRDSAGILMQRQPKELDGALPGCYSRVSQLDGVYSVQEPHFWTLCSDVYVGTIKVEVAQNADVKYVLSQTHNVFTAAGVRQMYVQIDVASV